MCSTGFEVAVLIIVVAIILSLVIVLLAVVEIVSFQRTVEQTDSVLAEDQITNINLSHQSKGKKSGKHNP